MRRQVDSTESSALAMAICAGEAKVPMHGENDSAHDQKRTRYERYVNRPSMRQERGFACLALDRPTDPVNVGHALRAAFCFDARMVIIGGQTAGIRLP